MATVVKTARATNSGIASSRLKVDMGDLYKLEDDQGALFVTANVLGREKATQYEVKWHTSELRPKFDSASASATATATAVAVSNPTYFQTDDLIKITTTGEVCLVTGITSANVGIARSWGATAAADIASGAEILIIGPHYAEGAQLRDGRSVTEVAYTNQLGLWKDNFKITGTLQAISEAGGTYHGSDVKLQREDMLLRHKRDINLACLHSELGSSGNQRSMMGLIEFITTYGTSRTNNTSAVTFSVFMTASRTATRYNNKRMVVICSRLFAQIVSEWGLSNNAHIDLQPGAKMFGLQIMDVTTPHGSFRLLVDDALEGTEYSQWAILVATDKKGGPKWRYLRDTRMVKNAQEPDEDAYEEYVLTEGTMELGNPNYHYLFNNANTSS